MPRAADQKRTRQHCFRRVLWTFFHEILVGLLLTVITVLSLNWLIFPMLKGASKALVSFVSWFYSPITNYATALYSHLPSQPNVLVETAVLWLAALFVVVCASAYHRRRSKGERNDLTKRITVQSALQEKHFA